MNTTLILFFCVLIPTAAGITCYEGMVGTVQSITGGHESCRQSFDLLNNEVFAKGSRGTVFQFSAINWDGLPKCEAFENNIVVCACYTDKCNTPMSVIELMEAGWRELSQEQYPSEW